MSTWSSSLVESGQRSPDAGPGVRRGVIEAAVDEFRERAFHEVSLQSIAARAGRSVDEVQVHFAGFDDLVQEVVHIWYAERMAPILPIVDQVGAVRFLRAVVVANIADPALMRLLSALVNVCATETHPMAPHLQLQWMRFHALVHRALAHDVEIGREPATVDPASGAAQLIALYEGLQLQSMVRPAMNLLGSYDRAVTRLRGGWAQEYAPSVWEI